MIHKAYIHKLIQVYTQSIYTYTRFIYNIHKLIQVYTQGIYTYICDQYSKESIRFYTSFSIQGINRIGIQLEALVSPTSDCIANTQGLYKHYM